LIRDNQFPPTQIENLALSEENFTIYDLDDLHIEPLLFQTGYITIKNYDEETQIYQMGYPNQEVRTAFVAFLYQRLVPFENRQIASAYRKLRICLERRQVDAFIDVVGAILAAIPYEQIANQDEAYFHTALYLMLTASGVRAWPEMLTSQGRIDLVLELVEQIYIVELKCNQTAAKAIAQILERKYYERFRSDSRPIFLVGINFNTDQRAIDDCKWGTLESFLPLA